MQKLKVHRLQNYNEEEKRLVNLKNTIPGTRSDDGEEEKQGVYWS